MEQSNACPRCETDMYIMVDSGNNFLEFFCSECNFSHKFDKEDSSLNEVDESFHCNVCNCVITGVQNLSAHLDIHFRESIFICTVCNKSCGTETELKSHQIIHKEEYFYKCQFCEQGFNDMNDLQSHVKLVHENSCICPYCKNKVPLTSDFNTAFVMYCCPVCGGQFSQQLHAGNTIPLSDDAERPFQCGTCSRKFSLSCNLRRHLSVHTGERPFSCEVCQKSFKAKAALQRHEIIHTGVYPFQCPSCKQRFNQTANLWKHMLIHKEEYPYYCPVCEKGFNQRCNLTKHMKVHKCKPNTVSKSELKIEAQPPPPPPLQVSRPTITFLKAANSTK